MWIGVLAAVDALVLALTIHADVDFRPGNGAGQTSVTSVGQVLGWLVGVVLFVVLVIAVIAAIRARRR
jgi:hypothetical protein